MIHIIDGTDVNAVDVCNELGNTHHVLYHTITHAMRRPITLTRRITLQL